MAAKTVTVKSSGGDYTSLNAALSGESDDLVTNTRLLTIDCYNFQDTTTADTGTGYTVNSSYYIKINSYDAHGGKFGTVSYRLIVNASATPALQIQEQYTKIIGLLIENTNTGANSNACKGTTNYQTYIGCIFRVGVGSGNACNCIYNDTYGPSEYLRFINCIAINKSSSSSANCHNFASNLATLYNCTHSANGGTAFDHTRNFHVLKNCLGISTSGAAFANSASWSASCCNNASDDATAPGTDSRTNQSFTFVDSANDDFHLQASDTGALGYGINLYNDATYPFQTDIDGQDRGGSGATWDIGADEYVAAAGGASIVPVLLYKYRPRRT